MHELSIAQELADIVSEVARREKLSKIVKVNICFGELIHIVPDIFKTAFFAITNETIMKDAEVDIEILSARLKCRNCGNEFQSEDKYLFICNNCNSNDIVINQGNEMYIKSIEGE
jgi:hydrogenase nickel incorporation protein HypA/HybF